METPPAIITSKDQEKAKDIEIERSKAEKKFRKHVEEKIVESKYKEVDNRRYSFEFDGHYFCFRTPSLSEKVRIKSILAFVVQNEVKGVVSSAMEIDSRMDTDLLSGAKLLTHMSEAVVLDKFHKISDQATVIDPKEYVENLSDGQQFSLGYNILVFEREFLDRKKKV